MPGTLHPTRKVRIPEPAQKVLLIAIDDDLDVLSLISSALAGNDDVELLTVSDPAEGADAVRKRRPEIVLVDLIMPGISGMDVLEQIVGVDPAIDVILMTAFYSTESAVEAIRKGACDYLNKPFTRQHFRERITPLVAEAKRRQRTQQLEAALAETCRFEGIIGRSPPMLKVLAHTRRVGPYFRTVLITGPTGTGKELVAQAVHRLSPVAHGPFVVCNCAAIPENLLESELFGHVRGSFTSATSDKTGMFEAANGGTLFLDEIGEMPLTAQAKLLRAVENQQVQRVGSTLARKIDVRIVCASNRNLQRETELRNFREDLYFRISMVQIQLPSLAQRVQDIPLLIRHFIDRFAHQYAKPVQGMTGRAEAAMLRHLWPGNVRELENVIGYACMMTDSNRIDVTDFPPGFLAADTPSTMPPVAMLSQDELERVHARRVLEAVGGDKVRAAAILGVSRATLYRLLSPKG